MNRIVTVLAAVVLLASGCAINRTSEDVVAADDVSAGADGSQDAGDGVSDDGADASVAPTTTIAPFVPPTTGAPNDVALSVDFGDSTWEITHGELNDIVIPTQENQTFVDLVFRGTPTTGLHPHGADRKHVRPGRPGRAGGLRR